MPECKGDGRSRILRRRVSASSTPPSKCWPDPGRGRLSLSDVAATAGVSRPTLYHWFGSKEALLEAFGRLRARGYDAGIAKAVAGLEGDARLEAVLHFIVEFQHSYSLRRIVDVEPEHVVHQMTRVMPIMVTGSWRTSRVPTVLWSPRS